MFYRTNTRLYTQECKVGCFSLRSKKKGGLTYLSLPLMEKPRDFDPFGQTGFAHLWLQYD